MATTTKTLTPTNQQITLPDMTERPNNGVQVDSIGKLADAVNALNSELSNILKIETLSNVGTDINGMYISNYNMENVVSAYIATSTQLFVLVRPSTGGKAVMYVYQYNGTTLVPYSNETVSINVWVKE